ncbi:MAG: DUF4912 domain-containing protein [Firmicutes bacterium]|nr:DUF4912 domain-containing protein [Bacillota bacterium]
MRSMIAEGIPQGYGENILVLLVQNLTVLFAYWEVSKACQEFLKGKEMALRLYSVVDSGCLPWTTVLPSFFIGSWYFRGVTPGQRYRCELGWLENGEFYPLLCSETVDVPPARIPLQVGARGKRERDKKTVAFVEAVRAVGVSSGVLQ